MAKSCMMWRNWAGAWLAVRSSRWLLRSSWALRALLLRSPLLPACGPVAPPAGLAALSVALARAVALWLPAGLWWALHDEEGARGSRGARRVAMVRRYMRSWAAAWPALYEVAAAGAAWIVTRAQKTGPRIAAGPRFGGACGRLCYRLRISSRK